MTEQEMYSMVLHERKSIRNNDATKEWLMRVIGGWIYYRQQLLQTRGLPPQILETATFVPEQEQKIISLQDHEESILSKHDILDKEIEDWLNENYDESHKKNSLRKHLKVDEPYLCDDYYRKEEYLKYLKSKE